MYLKWIFYWHNIFLLRRCRSILHLCHCFTTSEGPINHCCFDQWPKSTSNKSVTIGSSRVCLHSQLSSISTSQLSLALAFKHSQVYVLQDPSCSLSSSQATKIPQLKFADFSCLGPNRSAQIYPFVGHGFPPPLFAIRNIHLLTVLDKYPNVPFLSKCRTIVQVINTLAAASPMCSELQALPF